MPKTKVLYHYFERDELYKENLRFFLRVGYRDDLDYTIIVNGDCSVDIPERPNIEIFRRANVGYDFGGYSDYVTQAGAALVGYVYLFFVNCTMRGPFLPSYCPVAWTEPFTRLLTGNVKLVGPTINVMNPGSRLSAMFSQQCPGYLPPFSHVQTAMFAMDQECFAFLRLVNFFGRGTAPDKLATIFTYEVLMSQVIKLKGWNISCLLPDYQGIDYRRLKQDINPTSKDGNLWYEKSCFGRTVHPFETVFFIAKSAICDEESLNSLSRSIAAR